MMSSLSAGILKFVSIPSIWIYIPVYQIDKKKKKPHPVTHEAATARGKKEPAPSGYFHIKQLAEVFQPLGKKVAPVFLPTRKPGTTIHITVCLVPKD
jgi:hypothetical protein